MKLGVGAHRAAIKTLSTHIERIDATVMKALKPMPEYKSLLSVPGIGPVIAWTIVLESGELKRFENVGHFASYCRCVDQQREEKRRRKHKKRQPVSCLGVF